MEPAMDIETTARVAAALGNELRLAIVNLVAAHREMCICELVDHLGMSQANISRHVSVLREAGVLTSRKVGTLVVLRVDDECLRECFDSVLAELDERHAASAEEDVAARLQSRCREA
jgi:DNA-binding transcriptional ArsR family regulator